MSTATSEPTHLEPPSRPNPPFRRLVATELAAAVIASAAVNLITALDGPAVIGPSQLVATLASQARQATSG